MAGCSQPGPAATISIPPYVPPPPPAPGMPRVQYQVVDANTALVDISWDPVPGATYYQILVDNNVVQTVQNNTSTQIRLAPGRTYQIQIKACN